MTQKSCPSQPNCGWDTSTLCVWDGQSHAFLQPASWKHSTYVCTFSMQTYVYWAKYRQFNDTQWGESGMCTSLALLYRRCAIQPQQHCPAHAGGDRASCVPLLCFNREECDLDRPAPVGEVHQVSRIPPTSGPLITALCCVLGCCFS